jgi:hypothetical protein
MNLVKIVLINTNSVAAKYGSAMPFVDDLRWFQIIAHVW